jgi:hypothetical protein
MPFRQATLALLGLALLTSSAVGQTGTGIVPATAGGDQRCLVGGQQGVGLAQIATNCPIGRAPALSSFRFGFFNGDHRFRQATLMPNGETYEAAWADVGGEDPWFIEARWHRVPEAQGGVVTAVVRGMADIPIPPGPANTTLVLSGFEFKRADGTDNNIRTIAIALDSRGATVRTVLFDDEGADYTNLATAIGLGFAFGATGVPDPNMSVAATGISNSLLGSGRERLVPGTPVNVTIPPETPPPAPPAGASSGPMITMLPGTITPGVLSSIRPRTVEIYNPNARPYRVRVAYLWVPNGRLTNTRSVSSGGRTRGEVSGRLPAGNHVLHGFSFHFAISDHFIGGFGVHLRGNFPVRNIAERADHVITWEDANHDDPIQWTARFSDFR